MTDENQDSVVSPIVLDAVNKSWAQLYREAGAIRPFNQQNIARSISDEPMFSYNEIKAFLCPYCRDGFPEVMHLGDKKEFVHYLVRGGSEYPCQANAFRTDARFTERFLRRIDERHAK
jgi:hypothetical protein